MENENEGNQCESSVNAADGIVGSGNIMALHISFMNNTQYDNDEI